MTVIATAGHVDHGKSTFVNFITGQATDRLPEEKKRGLTINLGYTYFTVQDKTYSVVDVPGHKDFYKNTIAGFANADVILFIIDSIQNWSEQSEQHFQSLISLSKKNYIFVFTKVDKIEGEINKQILKNKLDDHKDINYIVLEFNKQTSSRKKFCELIHNFIQSCEFDSKSPSMWVDRSFSIDGIGKVITGTASKGFDYQNIIFNLYNQKLQIKEVQSKDRKNNDDSVTKRIAISLKKTNKYYPEKGDLLSNEKIYFSKNLFIKFNDQHLKKSSFKGTLRLFFGTDNSLITKIKMINSKKEIYGLLSIYKTVPIPSFENLLIQNIDKNQYFGGEFLFSVDETQIDNLNNKIKNKDKIDNLLDIFDFLDIKFAEKNENYKQIKNLYFNKSTIDQIITILDSDINSVNKVGVKDYFESNYQISVEILRELIKDIDNIDILNNQIIKKLDNYQTLEDQYIKICSLLGKKLDVNIIDTNKFDRNDLKELFISKKIYRVNSKIIISDKHVNQLIELIESMPKTFTIKDFKEQTNLSRKYSVPYLELLDKLQVTQKIDKAGTRKRN